MSDIKTCLKKILTAVYGKDVRQSIHDAIETIDGKVDDLKKNMQELSEEMDRYGGIIETIDGKVEKMTDCSADVKTNTSELLLLKKMLGVSTTAILKENTRISSKAYIDLQEVAVGQMLSMSDVGSNGKSQDFADAVSLQKGMLVDITKNKAAMSCTDSGNGAVYGLIVLNDSSIVKKIEFIADMIAQDGFYTADADCNVVIFMPCDSSEVAYELHKKADVADVVEDGNEVAY